MKQKNNCVSISNHNVVTFLFCILYSTSRKSIDYVLTVSRILMLVSQ